MFELMANGLDAWEPASETKQCSRSSEEPGGRQSGKTDNGRVIRRNCTCRVTPRRSELEMARPIGVPNSSKWCCMERNNPKKKRKRRLFTASRWMGEKPLEGPNSSAQFSFA